MLTVLEAKNIIKKQMSTALEGGISMGEFRNARGLISLLEARKSVTGGKVTFRIDGECASKGEVLMDLASPKAMKYDSQRYNKG